MARTFTLAIACAGSVLTSTGTAEAAAEVTFDIFEFVVEGNTVLGTEAIERAVHPFMGERRTFGDVDQARDALERTYRQAGFGTVSVDVPEQNVGGGAVVLRVVQGEVSRLRVTGAIYSSPQAIIDRVPAVAEGRVPNLPQVQEQLVDLNRGADRRVSPLLRPGRLPGTTEVDLAVKDSLPLHGSVELNNRASPNTTQARLQAALRYDNLFQLDHSLALQAQVSPQRTSEVKLFLANYTVPLGPDQLSFSFINSDSSVSAGIADTTVLGKGQTWGIRRSFVIGLAEGAYHALSLSADYKDLSETVDVGTGTAEPDPLRYVPLGAGYLGVLEDSAGRWQIGTNLVVGLRGLTGSDHQFAVKRYLATSGFNVIKFNLAREQKLPAGLSLMMRLEGQFSALPLVSNEQLIAGGVDSVRGYRESAAAGDRGVIASLELRSPSLAPADWSWLSDVTAHGFLEGAALEIRDPLPAQSLRTRLLGTGFGVKLRSKGYGSLQLQLGVPLLTIVSAERGHPRVHASGTFDF